MILVKRKRDGLYISGWVQGNGPDGKPGYRHLEFTAKPETAREFTEEEAAKLCDFDFHGEAYGWRSNHGKPEFERENLLVLPDQEARA